MSTTPGREILEALRLFGSIRRQVARLLPDDVGPGGLTALRVIRSSDHPRVSDVAAAQHVGLPVASRQVRQLEEQGLLTREVSPEDRRAHRLTLTADGHALLQRVEDGLLESIDAVLADWPADDALQLARLMARFHDGISQLPDTPARTLQETR